MIPDKDMPGRRHGRAVCCSLLGKAASVRLVELPGEHVKDLSDWVAAGGTRRALLEIIRQTPELKRENVAAWQTLKPRPAPGGVGDPWGAAVTAREFLDQAEADLEFLEERLLVRGLVTEFFSPRGVGKTLLAIWVAVKLARKGLRVLYLNRDNPPRVLRQYMEAWHAREAENLKVLNRDAVPALTNPGAWETFPWTDYDVVVVDSLDSHAEGVGEQDSSKPSRAMAPLLDIAHRDGGPCVLVLGNTVRTGKHSRGSGVIEDRADITYEIRDITGWTPTGNKPWWEEMPSAGAGDWAARTTRRRQPEKIRVAFVCTKLRGVEPEPFVIEIDFASDPWTATEVTNDIDRAGSEAREARRREREEREDEAVQALKAEIERRQKCGERPLVKDHGEHSAVEFLKSKGLGRNQARELLRARDGGDWTFKPISGGRGKTLGVFPVESALKAGTNQSAGANPTLIGPAQIAGLEDAPLRHPHEQSPAQIHLCRPGTDDGHEPGAICADDPKYSGGETPLEGDL